MESSKTNGEKRSGRIDGKKLDDTRALNIEKSYILRFVCIYLHYTFMYKYIGTMYIHLYMLCWHIVPFSCISSFENVVAQKLSLHID